MFVPLWLICDNSHSIVTRQSVPEISIRLSTPGPPRQPRSRWENLFEDPVPPLFFSLCSDSEWGNWLEWLGCVGDWQVAVLIMSEVESCRDEASEVTGVCWCYWVRIFHACVSMCVFCVHLHMHAHCRLCSSFARLQIRNCKSIWNCVCIKACVWFCVCPCQETLQHYSLLDPKATQCSHSVVPYIYGSLV